MVVLVCKIEKLKKTKANETLEILNSRTEAARGEE